MDLLRRVVAAIFAIGMVLGLSDSGGPTPTHVRAAANDVFRITSPSDASILGDGNLVLVEGVTIDRLDGHADRVEVGFDDDDGWTPAQIGVDGSWSYVWADPAPGAHRIRARAFGVENQAVVEQSVTVQVRDSWDTTYTIANPYATRGSYRKGQLHTHSTNSFDGWESLPPGDLAQAYKAKGYQFVAITDHDVISHATEVEDPNFITIPAYESTADSGHITALWPDGVVSADLRPQQRLEAINASGGLAILNHPNYKVGWTGAQLDNLRGYFAVEVYNGITSTGPREDSNLAIWNEALNAKGWPNRVWALAVDDAHSVGAIDHAWVMVKSPRLTGEAIRQALENGAFYASDGPSFDTLGVLDGAITASSPDASSIRFIDQDSRIVKQGTPASASYKPTGSERWIRVEAVMEDGRTAWSQPFWLLPNAPKATLVEGAVVGQTIPGARVHVSDNGSYLGNAMADADGAFSFSCGELDAGPHELWVMATARWPDHIDGPGALIKSG